MANRIRFLRDGRLKIWYYFWKMTKLVKRNAFFQKTVNTKNWKVAQGGTLLSQKNPMLFPIRKTGFLQIVTNRKLWGGFSGGGRTFRGRDKCFLGTLPKVCLWGYESFEKRGSSWRPLQVNPRISLALDTQQSAVDLLVRIFMSAV